MNALLEQYGLSRTKLAIVAGLTGALAVVWGNAIGGRGRQVAERPDSSSTAPAGSAAGAATTPASAVDLTALIDANRHRTPTPKPGIADLTRHDPFAAPAWTGDTRPPVVAAPSVDEQQAAIRALRETGVGMVLVSGDRKIATIGDQQVQTGDRIAGFRVVDITLNGVVLDASPQPTQPPRGPDAAN